MRHNPCKHEYSILPRYFLDGIRCKECLRIKRSKSHSDFVEEVYKLVGNDYEVVGRYINAQTKIGIKHNECGHVWRILPGNFLSNGRRCPKCRRKANGVKRRKTHTQFVEEVQCVLGDGYQILDDYLNNYTPISVKHTECGYEWSVSPRTLLRIDGCPKCKSNSRGEKELHNYLSLNKICFTSQQTFDECRNIRVLPFDVFVENKLLIEYDGEQHFRPREYFGGDKGLYTTQHNDRIKNKYCINNSIPLIRIPYCEYDNIGKILDNTLKYFNIVEGECQYTSLVEKYYVRDKWDHEKYIIEATKGMVVAN